MQKIFKILTVLSFSLIAFQSCYDVEDGYRIDYPESSAIFSVDPVNYNRGAIGDTISFKVKADSNFPIKALSVTSTISGGSGTGYSIPQGEKSPFIDHSYGTVHDGVFQVDFYYNYIVEQDTANSTLEFKMVDEEGKKVARKEVITVPEVNRYDNITMYCKNNSKTDGLSTADGVVYHRLTDYEPVSEANKMVQESLDLVFIVEGENAMLVAPYDLRYSTIMSIRNKTKLKKMDALQADDFNRLTAASLSHFAEVDSIKNGDTYVSDLKVNDIIGFQTDFASTNSYNYGLVRINAIHPTNTDLYEGVSYMIEMDVVTQK